METSLWYKIGHEDGTEFYAQEDTGVFSQATLEKLPTEKYKQYDQGWWDGYNGVQLLSQERLNGIELEEVEA